MIEIEQVIIFIQIVFIDIVMAADNAIIIGLVAANFAPTNRKKIKEGLIDSGIVLKPLNQLKKFI